MLPHIDWTDQHQVDNLVIATKKKISSLMKRNLSEVWQEITEAVEKRVDQINEEEASSSAIPQIDFQDIQENSVDLKIMEDFKRKGAMVIRKVIPKSSISEWYLQLKDYLKINDYENQDINPNLDTYFSNLKNKKPQIFNVFWSKCQVDVRQHPHMTQAKKFLNEFWISEKNGEKFFEGDKETTYSDRIRIRDAGDNSLGLSPHIDGGSVERWIDDANIKIYEKIFSGQWQDYEPFDGAYRNQVENIPSPAVCRAFRTYQGWIALTPQGPKDGTLQLIPMLKESSSYLMLRPFLEDVPESVLCGAVPTKAQNIDGEWHSPLLKGLVSIPFLEPGDTVWWHCDLVHAVENQHQGKIESSVTYIGSAPYCKRNQDFLVLQKTAFLAGNSSPDFAPENRETHYQGRATLDDLTDLGKKQMGFLEWD